ncbi:molybdopterin dinucleotide binding domain-containing protein, partial [Nostocoides japonicum]|uniref:molybdopterin dinucleotide binding domain-containing protein n=1 Tax=Nostocoides japonicum TaxID=99481 RepID=UPI0012FA1B77
AGALGTLLPGGRPVSDSAARAEVAAAWAVEELPAKHGRDTAAILAAAAAGDIGALVVGGVDPADIGSPDASAALEKAFVVSLELRRSAVTEAADVVLPVAAHAEKAGRFVNWEGRVRPFQAALDTGSMSDYRVLDMLAAELGEFLGTKTDAQIRREMTALGSWTGPRTAAPGATAGAAPATSDGQLVLATWPTLLDKGRMQDGEPFLAGTARHTVAKVSAATAEALGVADGDAVTVSTDAGSITAPVAVTDMVDHVVWLPTNSEGSAVRPSLAAVHGSVVTVTRSALSPATGTTGAASGDGPTPHGASARIENGADA